MTGTKASGPGRQLTIRSTSRRGTSVTGMPNLCPGPDSGGCHAVIRWPITCEPIRKSSMSTDGYPAADSTAMYSVLAEGAIERLVTIEDDTVIHYLLLRSKSDHFRSFTSAFFAGREHIIVDLVPNARQ